MMLNKGLYTRAYNAAGVAVVGAVARLPSRVDGACEQPAQAQRGSYAATTCAQGPDATARGECSPGVRQVASSAREAHAAA